MQTKNRLTFLITSIVLMSLFAPFSVHPIQATNKRTIKVMTQNLYFGADLTPVITAPDLTIFITQATYAWMNAQNTNIPARMVAIAAQIEEQQPDLIGLQEVAMWRKGVLFSPDPATSIEADFLGLLLNALEERGLSYQVVAYASGFDTEVPLPVLGIDGRLSIADVILARADLPTSELKLSNPMTGSYQNTLTLPTPAGPISLARQWASVDVKVRGKSFRFVSTHLEPYHPLVRAAQAQELLNAHAGRWAPNIFVGDFNSVPGSIGDAAQALIDSGFQDAWAVRNTSEPGYTCCQNTDLLNPASQLNRRIDLILAAPDFYVLAVDRAGENPENKTGSGHWPSDHAGVTAALLLEGE